MTRLNIQLDGAEDAFVEQQVRSGAYADAEAVVRAALNHLRDDDAARTARFHSKIQAGLDELDAGKGIEVDDVEAWLKSIAPLPGDE